MITLTLSFHDEHKNMKIVDLNGNERDCVKAYLDKDYLGYMRVEFKTAVRSHHEWYPIDEFIKNNPKLKQLAGGAPRTTEETLGIVTASTPTKLTDTKQKWEVNSYIGFPVWISRGLGEGQVRIVVSNTKNTIEVDKKWNILPNKTSQYVLSYNIHNPKPIGNILQGKD